MTELPIQTLEREERLPDRVVARLEELVVSGVLKNGQRLPPERELARLFGVSRTVIREAMRDLSARGLVDTTTGAGAVVSGPSASSVAESLTLLLRTMQGGLLVEDLHEVRSVLETAISSKAAECATDEDIADMEDLQRQMEMAVGDAETTAELDVRFHQALAVAAHNPLFNVLLDSIGQLLLAIRRMTLNDPSAFEGANQHHREILKQVRSKNPQEAQRAMRAHLGQVAGAMSMVMRTWARDDPESPWLERADVGAWERECLRLHGDSPD